jgi:hypothetical protein
MQTSLFDHKNIYINAFRKSLSELKLKEALVNLKKLGRTFNAPQNLDQKIKAVTDLDNAIENIEKKDVVDTADFIIKYNQHDFLKPLQPEFNYLEKGFKKALYNKLDPDSYEFIIPQIHPAEVFIEFEAYSKAINSIGCYLNKYGEHAYLRQLQGYAFYKSGNEKSALISFNYALFNDPLQCSDKYLYPEAYKNKFVYLLEKLQKSEATWLQLPFALWEDGKTIITPGADYFKKVLMEKIDENKKQALLDPILNILQFNHLLYLAEMTRLKNGANSGLDEIKEFRLQMKETNSNMFDLYMAGLQSFGNY